MTTAPFETTPLQRPPQRTFLGHPIGLYVLFFTEMWERFSYYGMRALLILYMVNYFKWAQKDASTIYKVYTSFVYVTPILGGYLADRVLGNRRAVIIGAILMAIGHFLMAFEELPIFYAALVFLIFGNGFFKPNMSTQVGRLYPTNDGRRDGAYTIFYMGINLGAFLSPLVCGWLADNTVGGYHSGFTMAGIGMVSGLLIYLLGQPLVREIDPSIVAPSRVAGHGSSAAGSETPRSAHTPSSGNGTPAANGRPLTEAEAEQAPSVLGFLSNLAPAALLFVGAVATLAGVVLSILPSLKQSGMDVPAPMDLWDAVMVAIGGGCLMLMGYVAYEIRGGMRDRVLAILTLGVFVIFFWAAFEQAGNVLNLWADKNTDRYLTQAAPKAAVVPEVIEEAAKSEATDQPPREHGLWARYSTMFNLKPKSGSQAQESWSQWLTGSLNPVPTAWFQSINAVAIVVFAPFFALMWTWLDRRGWQPSISLKMVIGLIMMSASMAIMMAAAKQEDKLSTAKLRGNTLPLGIYLSDSGQLTKSDNSAKDKFEAFHAGRLTLDKKSNTVSVYGVLSDNERDNLIEETAPADFRNKVAELKKESARIDDQSVPSVSVTLDSIPPGFDMKYAGLKRSVVRFDATNYTLTAYQPLQDKETKALLVAGGEPDFRATIHDLYVESNQFRVSPMWLLWSYILATFGELCLSPVGLSMVSKLAPAKFATMLMGVWLLTTAFGNFAAGTLGEVWGTVPPVQFFLFATAVVGGAAVVLLALVHLVNRTMHGVN